MLSALIVFIICTFISMTFVSVFYHRGLSHQAVELPQWLIKFLEKFGVLIIGIDPKIWACMHRLHHQHSDTKLDPHSPHNDGFFGLFWSQKSFYLNLVPELKNPKSSYSELVSDIAMDIHWLSKHNLWWLPHVMHFLIAIALAFVFDNYLLAPAYFLGIAIHPIQGWFVNAFGHSRGYRNFNSSDKSTNNTLVAYFFFGEGYQNNHHQYPDSAKFSVKRSEFDPGYLVARVLHSLKIIRIKKVH